MDQVVRHAQQIVRHVPQPQYVVVVYLAIL
jgi:hypothetical protein